ncbi:DNA-directed RNA polymerase subunit beta [Nocardia sp. NPDC057353]|uniref:DNA-directed RNA polymerase subunit beta n=1 Tax=Nocardia sp. NPDC057353 TaxID=3346104 RepID=UPI00362A81E3
MERAKVEAALQSTRFYRMTCGLPALVQAMSIDRIVVKAGSIMGITMPGSLGEAVALDMTAEARAVGAIVGHHRSGRWTFIVRSDLPTDEYERLFPELFRMDVWLVRDGAEIALPVSPTDVFRFWVGTEPPRDTFRPAASVVLESVHRVRKSNHAR